MRPLPVHPDLTQLKRQAKELLQAFRAGDPAATAEVAAHYRGASLDTFALHDAQLALARAYGFASWPKFRAYVDGVTVRRLIDAVKAGDLEVVRAMLVRRPELVHLDLAEDDEHRALHHAVLQRQPDIVRLLMQYGADPRKGIYPHRDATRAVTLAGERGYHEIVEIIREESRRRPIAAVAATDDVASAPERNLRALSHAVITNQPDVLVELLVAGADPDETERVGGLEELVPSAGAPLRECAMSGRLLMAETLLRHGANPNTTVYAATSALHEAHERHDSAMIALLERHGGRLSPVSVGALGLVSRAARMLEEEGLASTPGDSSVAEDLIWGAIERPDPDIVRLALACIDWSRDDPRWHRLLENGLYLGPSTDRARHLEGFRLTLDRCDPSVSNSKGATLLHHIAASRGGLTSEDRLALATAVIDAGARFDLRDAILLSTPLGWACRWGRYELVRLFLERGADPVEADAEPWATPRAWAEKMRHASVLAELNRP